MSGLPQLNMFDELDNFYGSDTNYEGMYSPLSNVTDVDTDIFPSLNVSSINVLDDSSFNFSKEFTGDEFKDPFLFDIKSVALKSPLNNSEYCENIYNSNFFDNLSFSEPDKFDLSECENIFNYSTESNNPLNLIEPKKSIFEPQNNSNCFEFDKTKIVTQVKQFVEKSSKIKVFPIKVVVKKLNQEAVTKEFNLKTITKDTMVAPFNIPKCNQHLVKIPNSPMSERISILKKGGKLSAMMSNAESTNNESITIESHPSHDSVSHDQCVKKTKTRTVSAPRRLCENIKMEEIPFTSLKRKLSQSETKNRKKVKAYELEPISDPIMEKCRRNAINAKKNREIKKRLIESLESKIEKEKNEKLQLRKENEELRLAQTKLEKKLTQITDLIQDPSKLTTLLQAVTSAKSQVSTVVTPGLLHRT